ncbi:MAG: phage tail protein [Saprospiraceae bacterium]|nr:phage tail protein [Saprospiraceae bacterium]
MAGEKQSAPWPIPVYYFKVVIGSMGEIAFQEVSGLDTEYDVIEYRTGNNSVFSTVRTTDLKKHTDITLKKGAFQSDTALFDYFAKVKMNTLERTTVTIQLMNEEHEPIYTWTLKNAFPKKVSGFSLNAKTSDAAMEELVLVHEGITIEKG